VAAANRLREVNVIAPRLGLDDDADDEQADEMTSAA